MTYGNFDIVKDLLNLSKKFVDWNNRIDQALIDVDNEIDTQLQLFGETNLPLNPIPSKVASAANWWAAGLVRSISTNPTVANTNVSAPGPGQSLGFQVMEDSFIVRGKAMLKEYVRANYQTNYARKSASGISPAPP